MTSQNGSGIGPTGTHAQRFHKMEEVYELLALGRVAILNRRQKPKQKKNKTVSHSCHFFIPVSKATGSGRKVSKASCHLTGSHEIPPPSLGPTVMNWANHKGPVWKEKGRAEESNKPASAAALCGLRAAEVSCSQCVQPLHLR